MQTGGKKGGSSKNSFCREKKGISDSKKDQRQELSDIEIGACFEKRGLQLEKVFLEGGDSSLEGGNMERGPKLARKNRSNPEKISEKHYCGKEAGDALLERLVGRGEVIW